MEKSVLVKRSFKGKVYACHWAPGTPREQIKRDMSEGRALFRPFNESTGEYVLITGAGRRLKK